MADSIERDGAAPDRGGRGDAHTGGRRGRASGGPRPVRGAVIVALLLALALVVPAGATLPTLNVAPTQQEGKGEGGGEGVPAPEQPAPQGPMPGAPGAQGEAVDPPTPREEAWVTTVIGSTQPVGVAMGEIGFILADQAMVDELMSGDAERVGQVTIFLGTVHTCNERVQEAGKPPTARVVPVRDAIAAACTQYERGASQLARGIDENSNEMFEQTAQSWEQGNVHIDEAATLLEEIYFGTAEA